MGMAREVFSNLLQSHTFRLFVWLRIFWVTLLNLKFGSLFRFLLASFRYLLGNKLALNEFVFEDRVYSAVELLKWDYQNNPKPSEGYCLFPPPNPCNAQSVWCNPDKAEPIVTSASFGLSGGKPPTICYFTNQLLDVNTFRPRYGGGERYCLALANLLRDLEMEVDVYQLGARECEGEYHGLKVRVVGFGSRCFSEFNLGAAEEFYRISRNYDHCIYNLPELSAGSMREDAIAVCHGIWFDHDNYGGNVAFRTPEWYHHLHRVFSNPALWVSVDTNSINVIRALWPPLAARMRYIPNFVDLEQFRPPEEPRREPLHILFPRRSQVNRGSRILGDILERVTARDVRVTWLGEGDPLDTQIIKDLSRRDARLTFTSASFDEMAAWYRGADICVISTLACEGTSFSCLEGLASGCAVVSTNAGGLSDLVQDGYNGLLVDPFPESIAQALNLLIADPEERARLQEAGRRSAASFSVQKWRQRWTRVLRSLGWIRPQGEEASRAADG
jgi:glycosyltransferase involved in cell wall biosynthesis